MSLWCLTKVVNAMLILTSLVVALGLAAANYALIAKLKCCQPDRKWRLVIALSWISGTALGVWSGFYFEYHLSPTLRVLSAPAPVAFLRLEATVGGTRWVDYWVPAAVPVAVLNVVIVAEICGILCGSALLIIRRGRGTGC